MSRVSRKFPCIFPTNRELRSETGSLETGRSAKTGLLKIPTIEVGERAGQPVDLQTAATSRLSWRTSARACNKLGSHSNLFGRIFG